MKALGILGQILLVVLVAAYSCASILFIVAQARTGITRDAIAGAIEAIAMGAVSLDDQGPFDAIDIPGDYR